MAKFNGWIVGRSLTAEEADALEPFLDLLTEVLEVRRRYETEELHATPDELFRRAVATVEKHEILIEAGVDTDLRKLANEYQGMATLALMYSEQLNYLIKAQEEHQIAPLQSTGDNHGTGTAV